MQPFEVEHSSGVRYLVIEAYVKGGYADLLLVNTKTKELCVSSVGRSYTPYKVISRIVGLQQDADS